MELIPFTSVGPVRFGETRPAVREMVRSNFTSFRKGGEKIETDSFDDLGLHIFYDENHQVEFIETFDPADVRFRGERFLGRDLDSIILDMDKLGFLSTQSDAGIKFASLGIALYAPTGFVEGVGAHRPGYYDERSCQEWLR